MRKLLLLALLTLGLVSVSNAQSKNKKDKKVVELKHKNVSKSRGENPNIKKDVSFCDMKDIPAPKPAKSRGEYCSVDFGNNTGYYVEVYVDGVYRGMLSPWESGNVTVYSGYTTIYCITAGGTYEWGADGNCDGNFAYELNE